MMQPQPRLTEDERANLVAFLDGELPDDDASRLEEKVGRSVSVRREIQALEKTWHMLDWLPRLEAPQDFASQTVTRIHSQQMRLERFEGRLKWATVLTGRVIGWAACIAAAVGLGFAGVRLAWRDPTRELIDDLEIVENLESFRAIPDIKFLNDMAQLGLFTEPAAPAADEPAGDAASAPGGNAPSGESG